MTESQLKNRFICEDHFDKKFLLKNKLTANAVPTPYLTEENIVQPNTNQKVYEKTDTTNDTNNDWMEMSPTSKDSPSLRSPCQSITVHYLTPEKKSSLGSPNTPKLKRKVLFPLDTPKSKKQKLESQIEETA